jgi:hypothetical protein
LKNKAAAMNITLSRIILYWTYEDISKVLNNRIKYSNVVIPVTLYNKANPRSKKAVAKIPTVKYLKLASVENSECLFIAASIYKHKL